MFMSEKPPQAISFYKEEEEQENPEEESRDNMIIEVPPPPQHHHSFRETTSNGGEDNINNNNTPPTAAANHHPILSSNFDSKAAPKKRAETWVQEETRVLISLRREIDSLFNTTKSNKHLWDRISLKMRGKGFDRSPTMCTDKWRNLLKEFKKIKKQNCDRNGSPKMSYYKEIEEILKERSKNSSKVDSFMHFSDKGIDDTSIAFTTVEGISNSN